MRALTAKERADREFEARQRKSTSHIKAIQQAIEDHRAGQAKVLAKNDAERKRIEAECQQRNSRWANGLVDLEQALARALRSRPIRNDDEVS